MLRIRRIFLPSPSPPALHASCSIRGHSYYITSFYTCIPVYTLLPFSRFFHVLHYNRMRCRSPCGSVCSYPSHVLPSKKIKSLCRAIRLKQIPSAVQTFPCFPHVHGHRADPCCVVELRLLLTLFYVKNIFIYKR